MDFVDKPAFGKPCNRCGLCCMLAPCHIAEIAFGEDVAMPCPALKQAGLGYECAFVATEIEHALKPMIRESLGIGTGCGMAEYLWKD